MSTTSPGSLKSYLALSVVLFAIGLGGAWAIHKVLDIFHLSSAWWLETPGALTISVALLSVFDRWLWSWKLFYLIGLVKWPDLRGRWVGSINSSHPDYPDPISAALEIRQTASAISVSLYTDQSRSTSFNASIQSDDDGIPVLTYSYLNRPEPLHRDSMHIHYGSAAMRYYADVGELRGDYFTSTERGTSGSVAFSFVATEIRGRFS